MHFAVGLFMNAKPVNFTVFPKKDMNGNYDASNAAATLEAPTARVPPLLASTSFIQTAPFSGPQLHSSEP